MRNPNFCLALSLAFFAGCAQRQPVIPAPTGAQLPTGRFIAPQPTTQPADVGSQPMQLIAVGPYVISTDAGQTAALWSIRADDGIAVSSLDYSSRRGRAPQNFSPEQPGSSSRPARQPRRRASNPEDSFPPHSGLYFGLAADNQTVYASMGAADAVAVVAISPDGRLARAGTIACRPGDFPAGLALDSHGHLYVANNTSSSSYESAMTPASVSIYDTAKRRELGRFVFSQSYFGTSNFPYAIAATPDGSRCFVASERDGIVYVLDTSDPARISLRAELATGAEPVSLVFSPDHSRIYVANAGSDTLSTIDVAQEKVIDTLVLRPPEAHGLAGTTPTCVAPSPDGKTLYVTLADFNAIAVVDAARMTVRGFIPAGWYPTGIVISPDGNHLLVTDAKGNRPRIPRLPPSQIETYRRNGKPATRAVSDPTKLGTRTLELVTGDVMQMPIPSAAALPALTQQVLADSLLPRLAVPPPAVFAQLTHDRIKHVVYIIKENRSYDQMLGDVRAGNGDKSLVIFGPDVTPNQHALALRFVLLDNCYACGEVSGDGWVWSTQGIANPYVIRNVPYYYTDRGRGYDFEGQNNNYPSGGLPPRDPDGLPPSTAPALSAGLPPIPDVAESRGGFIWDAAARAHRSYRNWGMFLSMSSKSGVPEGYPTAAGLQPPGHDLAGRTDWDYRQFDLNYADSDAPAIWYQRTNDENCLPRRQTFGKAGSTSRFTEWNREFQMLLSRDPSGAAVPDLMLIRLPDDHTNGLSRNARSPRAFVADNDYAVGQIVDAISHSPIWTGTVIFIVEDDAQNGNDHVDVHRMPAFVVSPWIVRHSVDTRFYNTDSFLHTIELLLGMQPMSQYDAVASVIDDWESSAPGNTPLNLEPFDAILPTHEIIAERNPDPRALAPSDPLRAAVLASDTWDFSVADHAPADPLNRAIWLSIKGPNIPMPPPRHALDLIGAKPTQKLDDDDDD